MSEGPARRSALRNPADTQKPQPKWHVKIRSLSLCPRRSPWGGTGLGAGCEGEVSQLYDKPNDLGGLERESRSTELPSLTCPNSAKRTVSEQEAAGRFDVRGPGSVLRSSEPGRHTKAPKLPQKVTGHRPSTSRPYVLNYELPSAQQIA